MTHSAEDRAFVEVNFYHNFNIIISFDNIPTYYRYIENDDNVIYIRRTNSRVFCTGIFYFLPDRENDKILFISTRYEDLTILIIYLSITVPRLKSRGSNCRYLIIAYMYA